MGLSSDTSTAPRWSPWNERWRCGSELLEPVTRPARPLGPRRFLSGAWREAVEPPGRPSPAAVRWSGRDGQPRLCGLEVPPHKPRNQSYVIRGYATDAAWVHSPHAQVQVMRCRHLFGELLPGPFAPDVDVAVVRVAAEAEPPGGEFPVQVVQHDVGEQRTEGAALRRSLFRLQVARFAGSARLHARQVVAVTTTLRSDGIVADLRREGGYAAPTFRDRSPTGWIPGTFAGRTMLTPYGRNPLASPRATTHILVHCARRWLLYARHSNSADGLVSVTTSIGTHSAADGRRSAAKSPLEPRWPDAAASLREGLAETLVCQQPGLPAELRQRVGKSADGTGRRNR